MIVASGTAQLGSITIFMRCQVSFIASMISPARRRSGCRSRVRHEMPGVFLERHLEPVRDGLRRVIGDDVTGLEADR
jgi:hypothetical protein